MGLLRYEDLVNAHFNPSHHGAIHDGVDDAHLEVEGPSLQRHEVFKDGDPNLK